MGDPYGPRPTFVPPGAGPATEEQGWNRRAALATLLVLSAVVLAGISAASPWWFESLQGTGTVQAQGLSGLQVSYYPGTSVQVTCPSMATASACTGWGEFYFTQGNYSDVGLTSLGGWYLLSHVSLIVTLVMGVVCAVFMLQAAARRSWGRWQFHTTHLLALLTGILLVLAPTLLVVMQPSLLAPTGTPSGTGGVPGSGWVPYYVWNECGSNSPGSSFWNNCTIDNNNGATPNLPSGVYYVTWGAGVGWYLAVAAAALLFVGGALFLASRTEGEEAGPVPWDGEPRRGVGGPVVGAWEPNPWGSAPPRPLGLPPGSPLGDDALRYGGVASMEGRPVCRSCGFLNSQGSVLCSRCHTPLSG